MAIAYELIARQGGWAALQQAGEFFMPENPVRRSLSKITGRLTELRVDHAVVGGMALVAHGYERATTGVDLLVTANGLNVLHKALDGLGYLPPFAGSKHLRDIETSVRIEFLITGQFPVDGVEKPIAFPDPVASSIDMDGLRVITLERLIELKLASGISNLGRIKDLGDVQELIRIKGLDETMADRLHEYVRPRFLELLHGVRRDVSEI